MQNQSCHRSSSVPYECVLWMLSSFFWFIFVVVFDFDETLTTDYSHLNCLFTMWNQFYVDFSKNWSWKHQIAHNCINEIRENQLKRSHNAFVSLYIAKHLLKWSFIKNSSWSKLMRYEIVQNTLIVKFNPFLIIPLIFVCLVHILLT